MKSHLRSLVALAMSLLVSGCATTPATSHTNVLFVGNSLTYYNDMPGMFAQLARGVDPDRRVTTEMLATGGISMEQHLRNGVLARILASTRFDYVVLQDLGGWPLCAEGAMPGCERSIASLSAAVSLVKSSGARPIWYSTWKRYPQDQLALSKLSAQVAVDLDVPLADAGAALSRYPAHADESLLRDDGHPQPLGSWIVAATVLRAIRSQDLREDAVLPIVCHTPWQGNGVKADSLASRQSRPEEDCSRPSVDQLAKIIKAANDGAP